MHVIRVVARQLKQPAAGEEPNPDLTFAGHDGDERDHLAVG